MSISINLTLLWTWLVVAVPLTVSTHTCFAVGCDVLPRTEHFAAVHTGAVVQRDTVSMVILILVMWAVTATYTGHTGPQWFAETVAGFLSCVHWGL